MNITSTKIKFRALIALLGLAFAGSTSLHAQTCPWAKKNDLTNIGCSNNNVSLGAGEYSRFYLYSGVYYAFSISTSGTYSNGLCINGSNQGTSAVFQPNSTGWYAIGANRTNTSLWTWTSTVLTYRTITPGASGGISGYTDVCTGAYTSYSSNGASYTTNYDWQYSTNGGASYGSLASGSTSTAVQWPSSATSGGRVRVLGSNGGCYTGWTDLSVTIHNQPSNPTTASVTPTKSEVCVGENVSLLGVSGGGGLGCATYYRYSVNGGASWSSSSTTKPTNISASAKGYNQIIIQASVASCAPTCNSTSWVTMATWDVDMTKPTVSTKTVYLTLDVNGQASLTAADVDNGSTDACGIATRTISKSSFDCNDIGNNTVVLTVTDVNGNTASANATVVIADQSAPTVKVKNLTTYLNANGTASLNTSDFDNGSTDNCSVQLFATPTTFNCNSIGANKVLVFGADAANNVTFASSTVTVLDTTRPNLTLPADLTLYADTSCSLSNVSLGSPTVSDNCSVSSTTNNAPSSFPVGITYVTWTVKDPSGNTNTGKQKVTVLDTAKPKISGPKTVIVKANSNCQAVASSINYGLTVTENCTVSSQSHNGPALFDEGKTNIEWVIVDASGNTSKFKQTINVVDSTAPALTAPADITVYAGSSCVAQSVALGTPTYSDNCTMGTVINNAPSSYPVGVNSVTWTAVDAKGNKATAVQKVTVLDSTKPVIACPNGGTITKNNTKGQCGYTVSGTSFDPSFSDNCSSSSIAHNYTAWSNSSTLNGASFPTDTTVVTWTATDASGNTSSCAMTVIVVDVEAPTFSNCPSGQTLNVGSYTCGGAALWNAPTATDNCSGTTITQISGPSATGNPAAGTYTVAYEAKDAQGNADTCSFTVVVSSTTTPVLVCPNAPAQQQTDANACYYTSATNSLKPIQAVGNCPTVTWVVNNPGGTNDSGSTDASGYKFQVGTSTLTYYLIDSALNTASCSLTVSVVDVINPVLTAQADTTLYFTTGCALNNPSLPDPSATDNCSVASITSNLPSSLSAGTTVVTFVATDANGNKDSITRKVIVKDGQSPVIVFNAGNSLSRVSAIDECGYTAAGNEFNPSATDNCAVVSLTHNYSSAPSTTSLSGASFDAGVTRVVWTAKDAEGNTTTDTLVINVLDKQAPEFVDCPTNQTFTVGQYTQCTSTNPKWTAPSAIDNCGSPTVTQVSGPNPTASLSAGTYTIKYQAVDAAGNKAFCTFYVKVTSSSQPVLTCPTPVLRYASSSSCDWTSVTGSLKPFQAVGNCPTVTWKVAHANGTSDSGSTDASGTKFSVGKSTLTYYLVDSAQQTATCSIQVEVRDTLKPALTVPSNVTLYLGSQCGLTSYSLGTATATDNCGTPTVSNNAPATLSVGVTSVTWKAVDGSGNATTGVQTVTVSDTTKPSIALAGGNTVNRANAAGTCGYYVQGTEFNPVATDNCEVTSLTHNLSSWSNAYSLEGAYLPSGTNTIVWTATDKNGNTSTYSVVVTVKDTEKPVFANCINGKTLTIDSNANCNGTISWPKPIVTDNCGASLTQVSGPTNGSAISVGTYTVKYVAADSAGNQDSCQFTLVVTNNKAANIICPNDVAISTDNSSCNWTSPTGSLTPIAMGECPKTVSWTWVDPSGSSSTGSNDISGKTFGAGKSKITYAITDANGNSASCVFNVSVSDKINPSLSAPAAITAYANDSCSVVLSLGTATSSDNCSVASTSNNAPATFAIGTTVVTWTAVDGAGNKAVATQTVTVKDTASPVITCPSGTLSRSLTANCNYASNSAEFNASATDNCSVKSLTHNYSAWSNANSLNGANFPAGTTTVVWTAVDAYGNSSSCSIDVVVADSSAPTFANCSSGQTLTVSPDCNGAVNWPVPTATDNCSFTMTQTSGPVNGSAVSNGNYTVTYKAVDGAGNADSCSFTLKVQSAGAASIACGSNITVNSASNECSWTSPASSLTPLVSASCPNEVTWSIKTPAGTYVNGNTDASGTVFSSGTSKLTYLVVDALNDSATCSINIEVKDATLPTIVAPAAITVAAGSNCNATSVALGSAVYGDNCSSVTVTNNAPSSFALGTTVVRWTATDAAGNKAISDQTVTVVDYTAPSLTAPAVTLYANTSCGVSSPDFGLTVSDNCSSYTLTSNAPAYLPIGVTNVNWTATDASGNSSSVVQKVTVLDTLKPTITAPSKVTVYVDGGCAVSTVGLGSPSVSDNCTIKSLTNNAPANFNLGTTTVTWTVKDASGNTAYATQTVEVKDTTKPSITVPANISVNANFGCYANGVALGNAVATDNCTVASVTNNAPNSFSLGTTSITWTVKDGSGNESTGTQTVTVVDATNPTISAPANITVYANSSCQATGISLGTPTTSDNCSVSSVTNNAPSAFDLGVNEVTWTVTDAAGNKATAIQKVTVKDTTSPTITAPANVVVYANSGCGAYGVNLGTPTTSDNCSVASVSNNSAGSFNLGTTTVTWTVVDGSGNKATASHTVTVKDTTSPGLVVPLDVTVSANSSCSATSVKLGNAVATDNCSVSSVTNNAPSSFSLGTTTVTWTVVDGSGNTTKGTQKVTVIDDTKPSITAPADITAYANSSCTVTGLSLGNASSSDNCSVASVTNDAPSTFNLGTTTVTWTVVDGSGNKNTATQIITVKDTTAPSITAPSNLVVYANSGCSANSINLGTPTTSDNCSVASVTNNAAGLYNLGTTTITWTVVDGSGNSTTATQTITVKDTTSPTLVVPSDLTVSANSSCTATGVKLGSAVTTDNCSISSVTNNAPSSFSLGTTTVTWTVVDGSGNTTKGTQKVTVIDDTKPSITAPADITAYANSSCTVTGLSLGSASSSDNCSVASVSNDAPSTYDLGTTIVTWTVVDGSGNLSTDVQTITVLDTTAPSMTAPADVVAYANSGCAAYNVKLGAPTVSDNCIIKSVTNNSFGVFDLGTTTVTWTATDMSGNQTVVTQTVVVKDTTAPILSVPLDVTVNTNNGCNADNVKLGKALVFDNCSIKSLTNDGPSSYPLGTTTVTWTAVDSSGNTSKATQTVTVLDVELPVLQMAADVVAYADANCSASNVDLGKTTATDNCSIASVSSDAPTTYELGVSYVTWTAIDGSGNKVTATQKVTVLDSTAPVLIVPADVTAYASKACVAYNVDLGKATATDNCTLSSVSNDGTNVYELGKTTVTWTAIDASGNTTTGTQVVTVLDTISPIAIANDNLEIYLDSTGFASIDVDDVNNGSFDNCTVADFHLTKTTFGAGDLGLNWVEFIVTDASGNSTSRWVKVTVFDKIAPTVRTKPAVVYLNAQGVATLDASSVDNLTKDNVGVAALNLSKDFFSCDDLGSQPVKLFVTDSAGNVGSGTAIVTVLDTLKPTFLQFPTDLVVGQCNSGIQYVFVADDNCSIASTTLISGLPSGSVFPLGTTTVTYEVRDKSGNFATASFNVTVKKVELKITINGFETCSNSGNVDLSQGTSGIEFYGPGMESDNVTFNPSLAAIGGNVITYLYMDSTGCTLSGQFVISVNGAPFTPVIERVTATMLQVRDEYPAYQWYRDGAALTGEVNRSITLKQTGIYTVEVTTPKGCTARSGEYGFGVSVSTEELLAEQGFQVFPNPSQGDAMVILPAGGMQTATITIFDAAGKQLREMKTQLDQTRLDLSDMANGLYYIQVTIGETRGVQSIVIQH